MMKKVVFFVVFAILLTAVFAVCAFSADGVEYRLSDNKDYYTLVSYTKNEAEAKISSAYNGLPVKKIAAGAFSGNISTYKIVIPDSITEIEAVAFSAMPSLYEFEAAGAYTVSDGALYTADKKTLVRYPEAKTGSYTVPSGVTVYAHAFSGSALTSLDASGATSIGEYAFYSANIKSVTLSSGLKSIKAHAFEKSAIEKIEVPGKTSVSEYAFSNCEKLVYADLQNASLDGAGVFNGCTSLLAVSYPADQTNVPSYTFCGCTSLVTAPAGKNTDRIDGKAFYGCVSLKYAAVGSANVAGDAFGLCDNVVVTSKTYKAVSVQSSDVTLKVGKTATAYTDDEYDLFTVLDIISLDRGVIRAVSEGEAEVYAVSRRGGDCKVINVTVSDGPAVIQSNHPYDTGKFSYTYTVSGNPSRIAVTFSSSDCVSPSDSIAVYDKDNNCYGFFMGGKLAGKTLFIDKDTVRVEIVSLTGGSYGFRVVSAVPVSSLTAITGISLEQSLTLKPGEYRALSPAVTPDGAFPDELIYITADRDVVTVSADGVLFAVGEGETDVAVYSSFYGVSAVCRVKVEKKGSDFPEFDYVVKNGGAFITNYTGSERNCVIPAMIDGRSVLGIESGAFFYKSIKSVNIPSSVYSISADAFDGCTSLTEFKVAATNMMYSTDGKSLMSRDKTVLYKVACGLSGTYKVPDTVREIREGAFACCFKIEAVELGANTAAISVKAFRGASALKRITADNSSFLSVDGVLYTADKKTLVFCPPAMNVHTYTVAATAEKIGAYAFSGAQISGIIIPASVSDIDATAFFEAYFLDNITVNSSNKKYTVSGGALYENGALKFVPKTYEGEFTVPDTVTNILPYAFYNCGMTDGIVFGTRLSTVGDYAFGNCRSLSRLYLPETVTSVGYDAFYNDDLLSVYIPDNASVAHLSSCTVLCAGGSNADAVCARDGVSCSYTYCSKNGVWTVYSPVKGQLQFKENNDDVYISKLKTAAGQNVKAYDLYILSDGVALPCGEHTLIKGASSTDYYYYYDNGLLMIGQTANDIYRYENDRIVELFGGAFTERIAVRTPPDKTVYNKYENIDITGLTLYYTDKNGVRRI